MVTLEERLKEIDSLPAVPASMAQLMNVLSEDQPDALVIERGFVADPALSLSALRMANSAQFAGVEPTSSVHEATVRLGKRNLFKIVLLHFTSSALREAGSSYGLGEGEAWRAALAGGTAAEWIASRVPGVDPAVAFTASLLRDCGKLAMDHILEGDQLVRSLQSCERPVDQIALEQECFQLDHAEVGAALASCWGMTEELQEAIRFHHHPPNDPPVPLIDVVYASELVVAHLGIGVGVEGLRYELEEGCLERIGFSQQVMSRCMESTLLKLGELQEDVPFPE